MLSICPFLLQSNWACQLWCRIQFLQIEKNGALECLYTYEGTLIQRDLQPCLQRPQWMSHWRKHQQPRTEILTKKHLTCLVPFHYHSSTIYHSRPITLQQSQYSLSQVGHTDFVKNRTWGATSYLMVEVFSDFSSQNSALSFSLLFKYFLIIPASW